MTPTNVPLPIVVILLFVMYLSIQREGSLQLILFVCLFGMYVCLFALHQERDSGKIPQKVFINLDIVLNASITYL